MVRHQLYIKRKAYQLQSLEKELRVLNARVRFILEFIDGKIVIANRSKKNLLEQLLTRQYPNLNFNISEIKIDDILTDNGYDYLIKMPIYNLTKERIEELNKEKDHKKEIYQTLLETTEEDIWLGELKNLGLEYHKFLKVKASNIDEGKTKRRIIKKKR